MRHGADNRLSTLVHRDVFDPDSLLASASISLERLDLRREGAGELIEGALRAILLRNGFHMREAAREGHDGVVDGGHLRREHGLDVVLRLHAFDHRKHKVEPPPIYRPPSRSGTRKLSEKTL